ncbi:ribosomal protein L36e [Metarhizium guizhouense ARSEF 977]|uniref:Ribosomal protein L36e n=1 Tax=Metarhizium guizhouense (strain ARSEF 977) TaxID=1276136 RepID=A0A0B4GV53_METGA|nr:ribosomal protein L36e [Metarhizium guizhouense ARSEF 977]
MEPPRGVVPNFERPTSSTAMFLIVISVCLAVSTIAVLFRFYSRWVVLRKFELQEYLCLTSYTIYLSILIIYIRLSWNPGWFVHQWDLNMGGLMEFLRLSIPTTCMFLSLMITIKTAILVEWICIFLPNGGSQRHGFFWACHFIIWVNIIYCTVAIILVNLSCVPHEDLWNRTIMGGCCRINTAHLGQATACFAVASDTIILFIPQRIIWALNMSRRRKLGVSVVFMLGMAACAASIVRLYVTSLNSTSADLTYHLSMVQLTAVGEGACGILVLCVPTVPKAVSGMKRKGCMASLLSRARRQTQKDGPGGGDRDKNDSLSWHMGSSLDSNRMPLRLLPNINTDNLELGETMVRSTRLKAAR